MARSPRSGSSHLATLAAAHARRKGSDAASARGRRSRPVRPEGENDPPITIESRPIKNPPPPTNP